MPAAKSPLLLFATESYSELAARMLAAGPFEQGEVERRHFPDGERYQRVLTDSERRDVVLLGGTISDEDTLEMYDLACALVAQGAHTLTLVIPFFGYATMERAVKSGEVVVAKTRARLLSAIPAAGSGNRVVLLDLHSEGTTHYFSGAVRPVHLFARPVIEGLLQSIGGEDFVLGAADAGRAKWVQSLANRLGVDAAFVFKRRLDADRVQIAALAADVSDRHVVLYDDMIRTGSSLIAAAQAYRDAGARATSAVATHGVLPGDALQRLQATGLFAHIACTDSHPRAIELSNQGLDVASTATLLTKFLAD